MSGISDLSAGPGLYPQKFDFARDSAFLIAMGEADYRQASFLDDRILSPNTRGRWEPYAAVAHAMAAPAAARPLHFILHSGHVGSTLLSRLLDETVRVLSLREPLPLRSFAEAYDAGATPHLDARLETFLRLWERGFASSEAVILKATSSAARLAPRFLTARPKARAVYLNLPAETYLATLLAGPNSPIDLNWHAAERVRRLHALVGENSFSVASLSLGELAAMSWLAERLTQQAAMRQFGSRILALDFEQLLREPAETIATVVGHFEIAIAPDYLANIARSPVLTRYSKAPEHAYSPQLRSQLLAQARRDHAAELRKGLSFVEALAARHAGVAEVLLV